jgi:hypothetical protein
MAFEIYNWSEVSSSMNQGLVSAAVATPSSDSTVLQGSQNVFTYYSGVDSIATISASNYFNQAEPNSVLWSVKPGDMIFVEGSDYNQILEVATVVLPVDGSSGTITTEVWGNSSLVEAQTTTTITNAQLLALYDTPIQLVPAQGAGSFIVFDRCVISYHFLTAQTTAGGAVGVQYASTNHAGGIAASSTLAAATLNGFTGNALAELIPVGVAALDTALENIGLYLNTATQDFATGGGSLVVTTYYRVMTPG